MCGEYTWCCDESQATKNRRSTVFGLLKMEMRAVKNEGNAVKDGVVEFTFEQFETFFCKERPLRGEALHLRIIVDAEVFGTKNLPFKVRVLNFIPSKGIEPGVKRYNGKGKKNTM